MIWRCCQDEHQKLLRRHQIWKVDRHPISVSSQVSRCSSDTSEWNRFEWLDPIPLNATWNKPQESHRSRIQH